MFRSLYGKLAAVLLGLLLPIGAVYLLLTLHITRLHLQEVSQKLNYPLAEHLVSETVPMRDGRINEAAMKEIFHMLMVINPSIEVYLLDAEGTILTYSAPPGKVKRERVSLQPVRQFLAAADPLPILGDDPRDAARKKIFSAAPIPPHGPTEGYLYVVLGGEEFDSAADMLQGSYILQLGAWYGLGSLLFALVAGLVIFRVLTGRLRRLASSMDSFTQGDRAEPPPIPSREAGSAGDELDRLESAFRQMAHRILEQMSRLKQTDALRRELVAHVSHDLRTPLASLQGYLETLLLKEGDLAPPERQRYLESAIKHSERLGRLITDLFDLAKLDSSETRPRFETFSPGELVQDVAQKFQLAAEKKLVRMTALIPEDLPFVSADIGLIERVLENLLENAVRHTPAHGAVTVALKRESDRVAVQVSDTGCGIPQEEIPFIFDRYYRVRRHAGEADNGTGLGLAIAKRILDLHGSTIAVRSLPQQGTTFTFHLAVV